MGSTCSSLTNALDQPASKPSSRLVDGELLENEAWKIAVAAISSNTGDVTPTGFAHVLQSILQLDNNHRPPRATTLTFQYDRLMNACFQALFSALPFAASVHSLSLNVRNELRSFEVRELPWIAYAIFHPRASQSSWCHLELNDLTLLPEAQRVLTAMARGNNLLALLTGQDPTSDEYVSGVLEATSVVYTNTSESATPLVVSTGSKIMEVDVCGVPSTSDRAMWNAWVAVVVPAYGLGWVRSSSIVSLHSHSPSHSQLTGLRLQLPTLTHSTRINESLEPFIQELGASLTYLDISTFGTISASTAQRLLSVCPALNVLSAEVASGAWTSAACPPQLCEVSLKIPTQEDLVIVSDLPKEWLHQLHALRISLPETNVLQKSQASIGKLLAQASHLQYLHWRFKAPALTQAAPPLSYEASQQQSTSMLRQLRLPRDSTVSHAHGPFRARCAIAMLSVVEHKRWGSDDANESTSESAISHLDLDMLRTIFQFATSPVRRTICIEEDRE